MQVEKGLLIDAIAKIEGNEAFDYKKLSFRMVCYPSGDDLIIGINYGGVECEPYGCDTVTKLFIAEIL
jgi:hypothetical protein